jgi:hypothetical protein
MSVLFPGIFSPIVTNDVIISSDTPILVNNAIPGTGVVVTGSASTVLNVLDKFNTNFKPLVTFPIAPSLNLNLDPRVHEQMTEYFYDKTFNEWIYDEFRDMLGYVKLVNGEPKLVSSLSEHKTSSEASNLKIRFLKDKILSRSRIHKILEQFISETRTNWFELEKNSYFVKDLIKRYMKKKIKALIDNRSK